MCLLWGAPLTSACSGTGSSCPCCCSGPTRYISHKVISVPLQVTSFPLSSYFSFYFLKGPCQATSLSLESSPIKLVCNSKLFKSGMFLEQFLMLQRKVEIWENQLKPDGI